MILGERAESGETRPIALVTGVTGGIGRAIVARLAADGYRVVGTDLAEQAVEGMEIFRPFDLSDLDGIDGLVGAVEEEIGPIALLVNNAAYFSNVEFPRIEASHIMRALTVNVAAVMLLCRSVADRMSKRGGGAIVNMASIAGKRGSTQAEYGASKAGVINLTGTLSKIYAPGGVRINAIAPGFVEAGMGERLRPEVREGYLNIIPMGRGADASEIAGVVSFLAGPDASYMTGETINVVGGL